MQLIQPLLFNPKGDDSLLKRQIFKGDSTNLYNLNEVKFKWCPQLRELMLNAHWIPQKVDFQHDVVMYSELTDDEQKAYDGILSYLTYLDSIQTNNLPELAKYVTAPEVKGLFSQQVFQEEIHNQSYQFCIETVIPTEKRNKVYDFWREDIVLLQRCRAVVEPYQRAIDSKEEEDYLYALWSDYLLEGIYFWSGFMFFYTLASRGLMPGSRDMIAYINRDEDYHVRLFQKLMPVAMDSFPHSQDKLLEMMAHAVAQEIQWAEHIIGENILGITSSSLDTFLKWLANKRLKAVGLPVIFPEYDTIKNPFAHLERISNVKGDSVKANFFDSTVTGYQMSSAVDGWGDI